MKKTIFALAFVPCAVYGEYWCDYYNPSGAGSYSGGNVVCPNGTAYTYNFAENCATREYVCIPIEDSAAGNVNGQDVVAIGCKTCNSGYSLKFVLSGDNTDCTYIYYNTCVSSSSDSTSGLTEAQCVDTEWSDYDVGYQRKYKRQWTGQSCMNVQYVYRCNVGYYGISSEAGSASGCSLCPDATDVYVDSALTQYATVSGGYIMSTPGANGSVAQCYLKGGTYYDSIGTYKYAGVCYQNGTAGSGGDSSSGGVDCSSVGGVCTNSSGTVGAIVSGTKSNVSGGTNCWCNVAGKSFFLANQNTYCGSACANACSSWVVNDTNSVATKLGC